MKPRVPKVDGVRVIDRFLLNQYEKPTHKEATNNKNVIVYYSDEDDVPAYLTAEAPPSND